MSDKLKIMQEPLTARSASYRRKKARWNKRRRAKKNAAASPAFKITVTHTHIEVHNTITTVGEPKPRRYQSRPWSTATTNGVTRFIANEKSSWHLQLSGKPDLTLSRDVFDVDLFDVGTDQVRALQLQGCYVIAYFNGGAWQPDKPDSALYPRSIIGKKPMDGWPAERWLDIRQLDILRPLIANKLQLARSKGFNGVDPDNMDGYSNTDEFALTMADQLAFNRMVAQEAQALGLAVFLKNSSDLVGRLCRDFDGAVVEQAFQYNEASSYQPFRDLAKPVFEVEYGPLSKANLREAHARGFNVIKARLALDGATEQMTHY